MSSPTPSPGSAGRPAWLLPVTILALAAILWSFLGRRSGDAPGAKTPVSSEMGTSNRVASTVAEARPRTLHRDPASVPGIEAAPETTSEAPAITPELRQERVTLFEKLTTAQDPTLSAVTKAFEVQGVKQPEVIASGWILAQHWAIAARAEALVEAKVEDPAKRAELAEVRRRILINVAEAEVKGLLGSSPDSRLFTDLEGIGRGLKESPPVDADLLPYRAAAKASRNAPKPKSDLPSEE